MKLYLLSQDENSGYDTYDSCVVAAIDEGAARRISPFEYYTWSDDHGSWCFTYVDGSLTEEYHPSWANDLDAIKVKYIGEASQDMKAGVVCASYNAG